MTQMINIRFDDMNRQLSWLEREKAHFFVLDVERNRDVKISFHSCAIWVRTHGKNVENDVYGVSNG